jgi:hypothetical protein
MLWLYFTLIQLQGESFPSLVKRDDETLDKNPYGENSSVQGLQPCESIFYTKVVRFVRMD